MKEQTPCVKCPLRRREVFREFGEEELSFVSRFKTGELVVEPGATILQEDNHSPHIYTLLEGWAFRHKQLEDGRRQILNFVLPGDLIGLQSALMNEMQHSVTALTKTRLCVFQRDKLGTLFREYPGLAYSITWLAAREEQMLDGHLLSVGQRTALERAAYYILHLYQRAEDLGLAKGDVLQAPFSKSHFADAMGITPVHASRTIRKLHEGKLIRWTSEHINLLDRDGLVELSGYEKPSSKSEERPLI